MPKVSVIIPTYNRAHFVSDAVDSVLGQTFKDLEIIVIDDGSLDETRRTLEKYGSRINYLHQEHQGLSRARNAGIELAKAEYIAFLDDDDIWLPEKLEKQLAFLEAGQDYGLVHTLTKVIDAYGNPMPGATRKRFRFYKKAIKRGYTYEQMSRMCVMFFSTVLLRKKCLQEVGFFDGNIEAFEDWDFVLRFSQKYRIATIQEPLIKFRIHGHNTSDEAFTKGRIKVALKHLAMLKACKDIKFRNLNSYNFYVHLANVYYMAMDRQNCIACTLSALKLNPWAVFRIRLMIHWLAVLLPHNMLKRIRRFKSGLIR